MDRTGGSPFLLLPIVWKCLLSVVIVVITTFLLSVSSWTTAAASSQTFLLKNSFYDAKMIPSNLLDKHEQNALASPKKLTFENAAATIGDNISVKLWRDTHFPVCKIADSLDSRNKSLEPAALAVSQICASMEAAAGIAHIAT